MTTHDELDAVLDRFFAEGPVEIDDAVVDASLIDIETIAQRRAGFGPRRIRHMSALSRTIVAAAAAVIVAVLASVLVLRPTSVGPGATSPVVSPSPSAGLTASPSVGTSPSATPSRSVTPSPSAFAEATVFTSPTYGYSVTLPAGWMVVPATVAWSGTSAPGDDSPESDHWVAPHVTDRCQAVFVCAPSLWAFSGPTTLDLEGWVAAQDAAAERDHPCGIPISKTTIQIDGQPATLEDGHCGSDGPLLLIVYTVRNGTGYAFLLQDNAREAAVDDLDRSEFNALLRTIRLGAA